MLKLQNAAGADHSELLLVASLSSVLLSEVVGIYLRLKRIGRPVT